MDKLRQFHSSLKISQIKDLPKGDFLTIGDSVQEVIILQSETKMKTALGKNVKISFPKAFQTSPNQKSCYKRSSNRCNGLRVYRVLDLKN